MAYEDRTLTCVQCAKEFTFTSGEQEFYDQKGFTSDPKRCKECRVSRRKGAKQQGAGIYRSPAFENSAPSHQRVRDGRRNQRRNRGRQDYRAPSNLDRRNGSGEYRSPAFKEYGKLNPEQEYRAPGFRESSELKPEEEYRAPGFQEYANIDVKEEYRAPAYRELTKQHQDEKPLFEISCKRCGEQAMVPFFPEEQQDAFCQECYTLIRAEQAALRKQSEEAQLKEDASVAAEQQESLAADDESGQTPEDEVSRDEVSRDQVSPDEVSRGEGAE